MRTLNADQLKAVLSMESSLGHIHTLADVENTIDYLAKEEPEAVAGVEKFNIFDTMWSRKIQAAFPQSFVNMQNELVFSLRTDSGFSLKDVTDETQLKAKILEWLTRTAIKAVSPKERKLHFEGINKLLGTNFTLEEMTDIYTYLGNGINHDLCVKFVESGYDMQWNCFAAVRNRLCRKNSKSTICGKAKIISCPAAPQKPRGQICCGQWRPYRLRWQQSAALPASRWPF